MVFLFVRGVVCLLVVCWFSLGGYFRRFARSLGRLLLVIFIRDFGGYFAWGGRVAVDYALLRRVAGVVYLLGNYALSIGVLGVGIVDPGLRISAWYRVFEASIPVVF